MIEIEIVEGSTSNLNPFKLAIQNLLNKGFKLEGNIQFCKRSELDSFQSCYQIMIRPDINL